MAIMSISVVPVGTGSASVSHYVAEMVKLVRASGLRFQLTPMATVVEGELEELLRLAGQLHRLPLRMGAPRVVTTIKLDERTDKPMTMEGKLRSVEEKLP